MRYGKGWNVMSIKIQGTFVELFFISHFFAINSPSLLSTSSFYFPLWSLHVRLPCCSPGCGFFIAPLFYHTISTLRRVGGGLMKFSCLWIIEITLKLNVQWEIRNSNFDVTQLFNYFHLIWAQQIWGCLIYNLITYWFWSHIHIKK